MSAIPLNTHKSRTPTKYTAAHHCVSPFWPMLTDILQSKDPKAYGHVFLSGPEAKEVQTALQNGLPDFLKEKGFALSHVSTESILTKFRLQKTS